MRFLQEAFNQVCSEAKPAQGWYVTLMVEEPYYGGPEEGGWWGSDTAIVAYQYFQTEEAAEAAKTAVEKLAEELEEQSQAEYGEHCLRTCDWLDARGLDADFLPEPDGPERYCVLMTKGLPEERQGCRQYS